MLRNGAAGDFVLCCFLPPAALILAASVMPAGFGRCAFFAIFFAGPFLAIVTRVRERRARCRGSRRSFVIFHSASLRFTTLSLVRPPPSGAPAMGADDGDEEQAGPARANPISAPRRDRRDRPTARRSARAHSTSRSRRLAAEAVGHSERAS